MGSSRTEDEELDEEVVEAEPDLGPAGQRALARLMAKVSQAEATDAEPEVSPASPQLPSTTPVPTAIEAAAPAGATAGGLRSQDPSPQLPPWIDGRPAAPGFAPASRANVTRARKFPTATALVLAVVLCGSALGAAWYWTAGGAEPAAHTARPETGHSWRSLREEGSPQTPTAEPASAVNPEIAPPPETARPVPRRRATAVEAGGAAKAPGQGHEPQVHKTRRPDRERADDPFALRPPRLETPGGR